jgi:hypothetical protein
METNGQLNQVWFMPVMDGDEEIGTVKWDGYRQKKQWTALTMDGWRISDVDTYEEAERLIRER